MLTHEAAQGIDDQCSRSEGEAGPRRERMIEEKQQTLPLCHRKILLSIGIGRREQHRSGSRSTGWGIGCNGKDERAAEDVSAKADPRSPTQLDVRSFIGWLLYGTDNPLVRQLARP